MNLLHILSGQHSAFPRRINDRILMTLAEIPGIRIVGGIADWLYWAFFAQAFAFVGFMPLQQVSQSFQIGAGIGVNAEDKAVFPWLGPVYSQKLIAVATRSIGVTPGLQFKEETLRMITTAR